jgi:hypothetical protein
MNSVLRVCPTFILSHLHASNTSMPAVCVIEVGVKLNLLMWCIESLCGNMFIHFASFKFFYLMDHFSFLYLLLHFSEWLFLVYFSSVKGKR